MDATEKPHTTTVFECMVYTHFYLTVNTASFTVYDGSYQDRKDATAKVADFAFGINVNIYNQKLKFSLNNKLI